jgi:hypothetical protein
VRPHELARHGRLRRRALDGRHLAADGLARPGEPARRDTGEHLLRHDPGQRVAVREVRVRRQRHLGASVDRSHARPLDRDAPAAEVTSPA